MPKIVKLFCAGPKVLPVQGNVFENHHLRLVRQGLSFKQTGILSPLYQQGRLGSIFNDPSIFQHQCPIGITKGGETMINL